MTRLGCLQGPHPGDRRLHLAPGAGWRERQLSSKCRFSLSRHGQLEQFEVEALPRDGCAVAGSGSSSGQATPIWRGPVGTDRFHSVWRRLWLPIRPLSFLTCSHLGYAPTVATCRQFRARDRWSKGSNRGGRRCMLQFPGRATVQRGLFGRLSGEMSRAISKAVENSGRYGFWEPCGYLGFHMP